MNSQTERTRLAWRRTVLALVGVGGIGAVHLAVVGLPHMAGLCLLVALLGALPALRRTADLRRASPPSPATWEPALLAVTGCLLALAVLTGG